MTEFKYIFVTPRCYQNGKAHFDELKKMYPHLEVKVTSDIYMNMWDKSWTEDQCDNVVYLMKELPQTKVIYDFVPPLPLESPDLNDL